MKKTTRIALIAMALLLALSATGCRRVLLDESQRFGSNEATASDLSDGSNVKLDGATSLDARVDMGAGELAVSGGAPAGDALDASFDFGRSSWEPRVNYRVTGGRGELSVKQPHLDFDLGDNRNSWDIRLPSDVPVRLDLDLGAGESRLDLTGMMLEELEVDLGAGETTVDLSGEWTNDLSARIDAGVGRLVVKVPENVGVRLIGDRGGIGAFTANGFSADGDDLVNDAWDTAEHKLEIEINQGVGEVVVETIR